MSIAAELEPYAEEELRHALIIVKPIDYPGGLCRRRHQIDFAASLGIDVPDLRGRSAQDGAEPAPREA